MKICCKNKQKKKILSFLYQSEYKVHKRQFNFKYHFRVKLLLNRQTGEAVAMKMVDTKKHPDAPASVKKEVCIQKFLQHPNILRYFGTRRQNDIEYIFLEYAAGGELFDRIGMWKKFRNKLTNKIKQTTAINII